MHWSNKNICIVLIFSIILYSVATLLNAFVHDVHLYGLLRFIAGFGLAGELGIGVTLVSEILPKEKRTYGMMAIATMLEKVNTENENGSRMGAYRRRDDQELRCVSKILENAAR